MGDRGILVRICLSPLCLLNWYYFPSLLRVMAMIYKSCRGQISPLKPIKKEKIYI